MNETNNDSQSPETVFVVALTGGIASGKSMVSRMFDELGVPVIDTDVIAHELVEPGQPLLASIVSAFGQELLDAYGRLKRRKLRKLIFTSKKKRKKLEALMHPEISTEARRRIRNVEKGYCILVIPLLAEAGGYPEVDRVLVVDTVPEIQIERVIKRDDVSRKLAKAVLKAQVSREQRLSIADDVIENSGTPEQLLEKVEALHETYLTYCN
jgi:dephospho-CoA kinase